jgi:hypothetical protein
MDSLKNQLKTYMPYLLGIASLMSFIAISDLPYGYYTLLRLVVCSTGIIYLIFFRNDKFPINDIIVFVMVLLWNPIIPVYLTKEIWIALDLMVAISGIFLINQLKNLKP